MADKKTPEMKRKEAAQRVQERMEADGAIRDEMVRVARCVARVNGRVANLTSSISGLSSELEKCGEDLKDYPNMMARLSAMRRLVVATRLGLERNMLRHHEADVSDALERRASSGGNE